MATNGVNGHTNGVNGHSGSALCDVKEFTSHQYDYVVIGGGTAGCVVAARLTENPNITVGVIEAGENRMEDTNVLTPSLYPTLVRIPFNILVPYCLTVPDWKTTIRLVHDQRATAKCW